MKDKITIDNDNLVFFETPKLSKLCGLCEENCVEVYPTKTPVFIICDECRKLWKSLKNGHPFQIEITSQDLQAKPLE